MRIGIDLMGGDHPPELLFPAISQAAQQLPVDISLLIFATPGVADSLSAFLPPSLKNNKLTFQLCEEVITMVDDPLAAARIKKKSSLVQGIHGLKEKRIDALISAGNTGALIACAAITLPLLPGVSSPSLLAALPTKKGFIALLDAGGSIQKKADQLVRLAFLGAAHQRAIKGIKSPRVALLNIGVEAHKGNNEIRQAYDILQQYDEKAKLEGTQEFLFVGNIEAREVFNGTIDVLVTDGFSGNILLKTAEGTASFILDSIENSFHTRSLSLNDEIKTQFDYSSYPGAFVCGVEGIIIKMHGNATAKILLASIYNAIEYIEKSK